ncbi:hypothetical protein BFW01_g1799 [Lasiodiplodia theobromae]|uniref:Enoyl reductase (ER) domain-containing protein n=1 Tax=Lasiodiplodia theobromae TaxID=45133 RepID=A0A8H7IST7_9PEZI|nr:hypothetical protein BFW01_g1799 [Lasiodiplodia theobromae]
MDQVPTTRTALVVQDRGTVESVGGLPLPCLSDGQVLIKTASVALNPADAKMVKAGLPLSGVAGLDFAGTVVATRAKLRVGARVCGVVCGYDQKRPDVGAFADYVVAEADFVLELPDDLGFDEASTLPIGILTAGLALYKTLKLPHPQQHPQKAGPYALVYGASTATGTLITQLLQRSGLHPIAVCSPHNFDLARRSGATHCFDYHAATCAADIRALTADTLDMAIDCIATTPDTTRLCYAALGPAGGRYVALDRFSPAAHSRRTVRPSWVFAMAAFGTNVDWVAPYTSPASPATRAFAVAWFREVETLLAGGAPLRCHPHRVVGCGLDAIPQALAVLGGGGVSGVKLVCTLSDERQERN